MDEKLIRECIDKMAIKEVIARYAMAVDTRDVDGFGACFTENARWEWDQMGMRYEGRKALRAICSAVAEFTPGRVQHATVNHVIDVEGDTARSLCELIAFVSTPEAIVPLLQGFYEDDLVRVDGKWLIARRRARVEHPEIMLRVEEGQFVQRMKDYIEKESG